MIDAFRLASSRPWAIEPDALRTVLQVAARMGDPVALSTRLGRPLDNARNVEVRGDVAIIPVRGPIFRHAGLFTEVSGATATGTLARDFQSALDNPGVRTVVFDIDSPGGEVTGIHELANLIHASRSRKPIKAYIGGMGASAAYWIASAASEVIVDETALVGSIGVVSSHVDTSERDAKNGIRRIDIVSSASPEKRPNPNTDAGRAAVQRVVDRLADTFVGTVARNRGVTTQKVLSDFGKGYVMTGAEAVKAGMANRLGSLEDVIAGRPGHRPAIASPRKASAGQELGIVSLGASASVAAGPSAPRAAAPDSVAPRCGLSAREIFARRAAAMRGDRTSAPAPVAAGPSAPKAAAPDSVAPRCGLSAREIFARRAAAMCGDRTSALAPVTAGPSTPKAAVPDSARATFARRAAALRGDGPSAPADPASGNAKPPLSGLRDVFRRREEQRKRALESQQPGTAPSVGDVYARRKADADRCRNT